MDRSPLAEEAGSGGPLWIWPVATHLALVVAAVALTLVLTGAASSAGWTQAFGNWDSHWYLQVAELGYPRGQGPAWAYFPLYPGLIAALLHLGLGSELGGILVSLTGAALLGLCLWRLGELEVGADGAPWVVWLLLMSPFGFFFSAIYTEALFLGLVAAAMLLGRLGRWRLAGLCAALATATRVNGLFLLPALLLEAGQGVGWDLRRLPRAAGWILLTPLGAAGFVVFSRIRSGDWLSFAHAEATYFGIRLDWPWSGLLTTWQAASSGTAYQRAAFTPELAAGLLGLPIVALALWRLRPMYSCFMALSWLAAISLSFWRSVPRYELAFFPALFLVVLATERVRWLRWVLLVLGAAAMAYGTTRFARGLWLD